MDHFPKARWTWKILELPPPSFVPTMPPSWVSPPPKGCDRHHPTPCYPLKNPQRHRCRGNTEGSSTVSGESGWGLPPSGEGPQAEKRGGGLSSNWCIGWVGENGRGWIYWLIGCCWSLSQDLCHDVVVVLLENVRILTECILWKGNL